jgi:carboxypeptidase Taq
MDHDSYARLLEISREISLLESIGKLLRWDQQTFMPPKAIDSRTEQSGMLASFLHQRIISTEMHDLLVKLTGGSGNPEENANVRELRREHERRKKVPTSLAEEMERAASTAYQRWVDARRRNSFFEFAPALKNNVLLARRWADCVGYEDEPYDALLDGSEAGLKSRDLSGLLDPLLVSLRHLLQRIENAPCRPDASILRRPLPSEPLLQFTRQVAGDMGFDFTVGRLDAMPASMCFGMNMSDVRISAAYNPDNPIDCLLATVHEVGHGLYHQGLDPRHRGTPMGKGVSLGVHEAQARWWENFVVRSGEFWEHYLPKLRAACPGVIDDVSLEDFVFALNAVVPSPIRVEADEVTYNLHIMVRVELERPLINGVIDVDDLPSLWNEKMKQYLGVCPKNDSLGVLQDVHWSQGLFGYFPTYVLGNTYAAQLDNKLRGDLHGVATEIRSGQFLPLLNWMRQHVHRYGSLFPPRELIRHVTGAEPNERYLVDYLNRKYERLYSLTPQVADAA